MRLWVVLNWKISKNFEDESKTFTNIKSNLINLWRKFGRRPYKCSSNYWLQTLILDKNNINIRDTILDLTNSEGVMTRPVWKMLIIKTVLKSPQAPLPISSFLEAIKHSKQVIRLVKINLILYK